MIRERISSGTVLLLAYTAANLRFFHVRRNAIILKCEWPKNPVRNATVLRVGKDPFFFKKPSPEGYFGFLGFFGFWFFFIYICPEEKVFKVFSVSRILLSASRL